MADNAAVIAWAQSQILSLQKLIADLSGIETPDGSEEVVAAPEVERPKRGRPKKNAAPVKTAPRKAAAAAPEPEDDDEDDDDTDVEAGDSTEAKRAELEAMRITTLRKMAIEREFDEDAVKGADKQTLIETLLNDMADDSEDDDASNDTDDDEDDEKEYSREELEGMGIRAVKALAIEKGVPAADLKGLKLEEVIDLMLEEGDAEPDEDDDADDDDDESGEDDSYTREDFEAMSLAELKVIGRQYERDYAPWKMPKNASKPVLIDALLDE